MLRLAQGGVPIGVLLEAAAGRKHFSRIQNAVRREWIFHLMPGFWGFDFMESGESGRFPRISSIWRGHFENPNSAFGFDAIQKIIAGL